MWCSNDIFQKEHGETKLSSLNILDVHQLYMLETCKIIYSFVNKNLPRNLSSLFQLTSSNHRHATRNAAQNGLKIPSINSNKSKSLITFSGPQFWNKYCLSINKRKVINVSQKN